ncbi:1912_t:CDS:2, partial [Racocetra persica]
MRQKGEELRSPHRFSQHLQFFLQEQKQLGVGFAGIFERNGDEKKVVGNGGILELKPETKVYYTSSGAEVKNEVKQIKPLIEQIVGEKAAKNIQIIKGPKQTNGYDCGVYLIKYIEELLRVGRLELNKV